MKLFDKNRLKVMNIPIQETNPFGPNYKIQETNPLGKIQKTNPFKSKYYQKNSNYKKRMGIRFGRVIRRTFPFRMSLVKKSSGW